MSTHVNLSPLDLSFSTDTTTFFNNYYEQKVDITSNNNDAVISFFESITDNIESAKILASAVIYTAAQQKLNVMLVINEFRKLTKGQINQYLALYLNSQRIGSSYLGVSTGNQMNKYIVRTLLY